MFKEAIAAQGMTRTDRVYTPEHLAESSKQASGRPAITKAGFDDLWRKIQAKDITITYLDEPTTVTCNETTRKTDSEEDYIPEEVVKEIWMDEEDAEKMAFITPWGMYCYKMMSFRLMNVGSTYMRAMTTIFHDMIHKEIKVYVDDVIIKSKKSTDHMEYLRKLFNKLRRYHLKLNPAKCAFGVPAGKLLGFIKDATAKWTDDYQKAFDRIKEYLSTLPVLVPPELGRPLLLYLAVLDGAFGCVLGQYDETGRKQQAIYYLSKKFTPYKACSEVKALFLYLYCVSHIKDGSVEKAIKGQALADHLAENPVDGEYKSLKMYFPDEEVSFIGETLQNPMMELRKIFTKIEFQHVPRVQNEFVDGLAKLSSMIQHPDKNFIDPIPVKIHDYPAYCAHVEEEADGKPWFHDIKEYLVKGEYPKLANTTQKRTLRRLSNNFFHSGGILYRRTPDLGLLRRSKNQCTEGAFGNIRFWFLKSLSKSEYPAISSYVGVSSKSEKRKTL
ncbi:uncharacterized protein [Nicotiana sylvestris]|uniref:uncharacterized protein n=1 Tax=Nicotiana sylvestris TaxID=4096 RepID=UPI00388C8F28